MMPSKTQSRGAVMLFFGVCLFESSWSLRRSIPFVGRSCEHLFVINKGLADNGRETVFENISFVLMDEEMTDFWHCIYFVWEVVVVRSLESGAERAADIHTGTFLLS